VTDAPQIDAVITLAEAGIPVLTYGDMLRVPGSHGSLEDARAAGAKVDVIYSAMQALDRAAKSNDPIVFFATGFETTAVATAALLLRSPPSNLFVYSAHKWVPAAMEVVAASPGSRVQGYLAAGHAATITGWGLFEPFVEKYQVPVVVAGFEPLDILAGLVSLVEHVVEGRPHVVNAFVRCVSKTGNEKALSALSRVFHTEDGQWRGIARVTGGELQLREEFSAWDAARHFDDLLSHAPVREPRADANACLCGAIMTGLSAPPDCAHFGTVCRPESPVGACMVSSEGPCRIWVEHGIGSGKAHPSGEESLR
jgi:hydrogenase expression/formation protein HypD